MDQMINNIRLTWKLACMLRTYKTCDPMVRFSKCEFNNKLLGGVILLRAQLSFFFNFFIYKIEFLF